MSTETVKKWIHKAENDLKIARDEIHAEDPATDAICFHAQQCVEKSYYRLQITDYRLSALRGQIL